MSALIFVALAVAWAVYLVPQALKHHEAGDASRSVEGFSDRMRVLARREPVDRKTARLVVTPGKPAPVVEASVGGTAVVAARPTAPVRRAAAGAARRRRRVLSVLVLVLVVVAVLAAVAILSPVVVAVPVVLLLAWLVACRLMVRRERSAAPRRALVPAQPAVAEPVADAAADPLTEEFSVVLDDADPSVVEVDVVAPVDDTPPPAAPGSWAPVAEVLPTYVDKAPAARRSVRTIDLESTGVWTSGRTASDAALAREADEAHRVARGQAARAPEPASEAERRAAGS